MLSNSVCNHTRDKQIRLPLRGRPILLSLVWLLTELDSTQSYHHYIENVSLYFHLKLKYVKMYKINASQWYTLQKTDVNFDNSK